MSFNEVKQKLDTELEVSKLGDLRKFKFIIMHLNSKELTVKFFIQVLKYKRWQANRIASAHEYKKLRYALKKQLNTFDSDRKSLLN